MLSNLLKFLSVKTVYAHCDIPCGIYDPHQAQMAAHTTIRMVNLINEAKDDLHKISRMTHVKEKHASIVEEELGTLLVDYFKDEHFKEYPKLQDLILKTIKLTGKVKQEVNLEAAKELLVNTQEIAEIFWRTKGLESARIVSGYPTESEIVSHK